MKRVDINRTPRLDQSENVPAGPAFHTPGGLATGSYAVSFFSKKSNHAGIAPIGLSYEPHQIVYMGCDNLRLHSAGEAAGRSSGSSRIAEYCGLAMRLNRFWSERRIRNVCLLRGDTRGASAVEFALIAPVFLMIMIGTFSYGMYFGAIHSVQQLAAEAARATLPGLSLAERRGLAERQLNASLAHYSLLKGDDVTLEIATHPHNADLLLVSVNYDASKMIIWRFAGLLPLPPQKINRAAVIRRGGY
ncbi:TadE family protein [Terrihabitans sp. B22-R8]|uniref:TadE family protein n=1 Tax=Terrihabitans sp. B22-R8 TaxID=3425128 RepID=UPI00403C5918